MTATSFSPGCGGAYYYRNPVSSFGTVHVPPYFNQVFPLPGASYGSEFSIHLVHIYSILPAITAASTTSFTIHQAITSVSLTLRSGAVTTFNQAFPLAGASYGSELSIHLVHIYQDDTLFSS